MVFYLVKLITHVDGIAALDPATKSTAILDLFQKFSKIKDQIAGTYYEV